MSHFSTITHHETPQLRHVSRGGIEIAVAIVALGAALVFVISQNEPTADQAQAPAAAATGLAAEDFLRLNTIDLEYLSPAISDLPGTASAATVDPFEYANIGSYEGLNRVHEARYAVDPDFMKINVEFHDWLGESTLKNGPITEPILQPGGPR
jgi:hypothetical protein